MLVSEAVTRLLREHGIDTVFGIPGTQTLPLNESIQDDDSIRFVMARHETAVSHQAWGYAETGDRMAATLVVPGPGDMNAMNGLKNAFNDCTPLLHLSVETEPEVRGGDGLHETPPDTYDNVVKENVTVETPASTVAEIERAIAIAQTPPTGPVRVGIPKNFLPMDIAVADSGEYDRRSTTDAPTEEVTTAAELLSDAAVPVIVAGGGVPSAGASRALRAVAEVLDAPVVTTRHGKGSLPEDHDLAAGVISPMHSALRSLLAESDVALAVGTDLDAVETRQWSVPLPDRLIHVSMHPDDIGQGYDVAVGIVADAKATLEAILDRLPEESKRNGAGRAGTVRDALADRIAEFRDTSGPPLTSASVVATVRDVLPNDGIITGGASGLHIWMRAVFEAYDPRTYVVPGSWATMGTTLPAAMGATLANPDRDVVAVAADGDLMMSLHELHTVVAEDLPVVTLVCNNSDYAIISEAAEHDYQFESGAYGWGEAPINFVGVAENVGMSGTRVETTDELREALETGLAADEPVLVEAMTDPREPQAFHLLGD